MRNFVTALRLFLLLTVLVGVVYPLLVWGIGRVIFPLAAEGDILSRDGHVIGARNIAQKFANPGYFWPRPSAVDFNPLSSGGSNLGPTSSALKKQVLERAQLVRQASGLEPSALVPQDFLFASASGLDPHINPETAFFQLSRVAAARKLSSEKVKALRELVNRKKSGPDLGLLGEPRINVLELNLAVDELFGELVGELPQQQAPKPGV